MQKMIENFKYILFVIVLLSSNSNIFANDSKPSVKIIDAENYIFTIAANYAKSTNVTIRIFDEQGFNLLLESVEIKNNISKAYDLSNLPKGTYKVELEDEVSFRKYIVTINSKSLEIREDDKPKIHKPQVRLKGNSVLFNMLNLGKENVTLTLNNDFGEEIFSEKISETATIHKSYDLSKLTNGSYTVLVKTDNKVFATQIEL